MIQKLKDTALKRRLLFFWYVHACGADASFAYRLYCKFKNIDELYDSSDYYGVRLSDEVLKRLSDKRLDEVYELYKRAASMGIGLLCIEDETYPNKLKKIKDPPLLLFFKGKLEPLDKLLCVGMVGTRKMTGYGEKTAVYLANGVADCGATVISGLAKGIDGTCQRAAIASGGYTVGVLGNSIDTIYPKENAALFNKVYTHGVVISEYWPGCVTGRLSFPRRNRIIAGLSDILVVVEAPLKSGALITASYAEEQKKTVCVPPMPLTVENAGTAALLRNGARLITSVGDILGEYEECLPQKILQEMPLPTEKELDLDVPFDDALVSRDEKREHIYNFLLDELEKRGPETIHSASLATDRYSVKELIQAATALEIDGFVVKLAGGLYDAVPADRTKMAYKKDNNGFKET